MSGEGKVPRRAESRAAPRSYEPAKHVVASEIAKAMRKAGISKTEMAQRMKTSRTQLNRLLDPENVSVSLETIQKAAAVVGKRVVLSLEDAPGGSRQNRCEGEVSELRSRNGS